MQLGEAVGPRVGCRETKMGKSRAHVNVIGNVSVRSTQCGKEKDGWHLVKWGRGQRLALDRKAPPAFLGWRKEKLGARTGQVVDLVPGDAGAAVGRSWFSLQSRRWDYLPRGREV